MFRTVTIPMGTRNLVLELGSMYDDKTIWFPFLILLQGSVGG